MEKVACVLSMLVLAACGDDGPGGTDGGPGDGPPGLRFPITFEVTGDAPRLLAVADADGVWRSVPLEASGRYTVEVTTLHAIAMVCVRDDFPTTEIVLRTRFDTDPFLFCFTNANPLTFRVVTGEMAQAGQVSMFTMDTGTTAPWTFELYVADGTHDLTAFGSDAVLVRRNVEVTGDATLDDIDLTAGGLPYETTAVIVDTDPDETVATDLTVFLENGFASYVRAGRTLHQLPGALLGASEFQFADVVAETATSRRTATIDGAGTVNVQLLPRLDGVTFTDTGAMWSTLPLETAQIGIAQTTDLASLSIEATAGYLDGDTQLSVELDMPGYDDAWRPSPTGRRKVFTVYDDKFDSTELLDDNGLRASAALVRAIELAEPSTAKLARLRRELMRRPVALEAIGDRDRPLR